MILGSDQGAVVTRRRRQNVELVVQPADGAILSRRNGRSLSRTGFTARNKIPGAMAVRSQSIHSTLTGADWRPIDVGGESGYIAPDPLHPGHIFGGSSTVTYENLETG